MHIEVKDIFDGSDYGIMPMSSVVGETLMIEFSGLTKFIIILEANDLNPNATTCDITRISYGQNANSLNESYETTAIGFDYTVYKSVTNVIQGNPNNISAFVIDAEEYEYTDPNKKYRKIEYSLSISNKKGAPLVTSFSILQVGCQFF